MNELAKAAGDLSENGGSPMDLPAQVFRQGLQRRGENRKSLMDWIRSNLVQGTDYGKIHTFGKNKCTLAAQGRGNDCPDAAHWSKPVLFQPGAQKICGMLGVFATYPSMPKYEEAALAGVDLKHIILRCEIRDTSGTLVGDGMGARSLTQDYGDLNKSLKMAAKSSQISAVLRMAGLSEVFTQDIQTQPEDIPTGLLEELLACKTDDEVKTWYADRRKRTAPEDLIAMKEMIEAHRKDLRAVDIDRTKAHLEAMAGEKFGDAP